MRAFPFTIGGGGANEVGWIVDFDCILRVIAGSACLTDGSAFSIGFDQAQSSAFYLIDAFLGDRQDNFVVPNLSVSLRKGQIVWMKCDSGCDIRVCLYVE